ncbi:MAG: MerR family transcriptional regulator [Ruminococcaceae bacterium]|nr:MerR family transcriptional regulator [Oscillospiraceae bacterium]
MLKINEFAKLCGVTVHTLRYYDKCNILCPRETDPSSGYRYYHPEQKKDVETILTLKDLGFSLEDIRTYMNESIQVRRVMIGRKKREIEHHIHYEKDQIRTIHALCGQDILALSKETLQNVKSQFEDDPDVIGRWDYCGYLPPDAEFTGEENLLQDNYSIPVLFFLPGGEEVWFYFWSRGVFYHTHDSTNLLIPNPYEIFEYNGETYLRLFWMTEAITVPDAKETIRIYRKTDSRRYDKIETRLFHDKTDLPFVPDPRLVGTWDVYTFVYKPENFDPRRQPSTRMRGMFDRIRCTEDGALFMRMRSSVGHVEMEHHYTNGYFLNDYDHFAEHYEYREHKGTDYLISEYKTGNYSYGGTVDIYCVFRRSTAESES